MTGFDQPQTTRPTQAPLLPGELDRFPRVRSVLERDYEQGFHDGLQFYCSVGGRSVADVAYGGAAGRALDTESLVHWNCASKPLTSVSVGLLAHRGLLDLADPVVRYVPEYGRAGKQDARIGHLLAHAMAYREKASQSNVSLDWSRSVQTACGAEIDGDAPPGSQRVYSNWMNSQTLAEIVVRITGEAFPDFLRREILDPLGMDRTFLGMTDDQYAAARHRIVPMTYFPPEKMRDSSLRLAYEDYIGTDDEFRRAAIPGLTGIGAVRDLGRLYEALIGVTEGVGPEWTAVADLLTVRHEVGPDPVPRDRWYSDWALNYLDWSYGFLIDPMMYGSLASERVFGHGGERIIMAFADPEFDLVAAFTFNGFLPWDVGDPRLTMTCAAIYEDVIGPGRGGPHHA